MNKWIKIKPNDTSPSAPFITIDKEGVIFCYTSSEHFQEMDYYSSIPDPTKDCGWNVVTMNSQKPLFQILLVDVHGCISVGETSFDFYDSIGWLPIPLLPTESIITRDECVVGLLKNNLSK